MDKIAELNDDFATATAQLYVAQAVTASERLISSARREMQAITGIDHAAGCTLTKPANPSGINPLEFNVLIDPDKIEEKTAGGLYKPQDATEREKHQQTKGTIVALSPLAFNADIYPTDIPKPQPGQRVAIALHAGAFIKGADGREYRMVKDKDITAMIGN